MLGPQHPDTLHSRNNLAVGYRTLGAKEIVQLAEETPSNSNPICPMARTGMLGDDLVLEPKKLSLDTLDRSR